MKANTSLWRYLDTISGKRGMVMNSDILIVPNSENWEPEMTEVSRVLSMARAKGFRDDWGYCLAFADHALAFSDGDDVTLVFYKGEFMSESEYMDAP